MAHLILLRILGRHLPHLMLAFALTIFSGLARADEPAIAAASDLKFALDEIAQSFSKETGKTVRIAYGSSGNFVTQIKNGAPFQMFLSADEDYVFRLAKDGLTRNEGSLYAVGRIVLFAGTASAVQVDEKLKGLAMFVQEGKLQRFAIANPDHAPYGRRAEEALKKAGLWDAVKPKLVLGENISQAAQFAVSGSADAGIIALSLAMAPQMARLGRYAVIPESWHAPLNQRMVLLKNAGDVAHAFYAYLQQPAARAVFNRYGFTLPNNK